MSAPEVSVVMTAYRRAPLLAATLKSIFNQRFRNFEVIVVEDGDDGGATRAACEPWPVRYFQRKNRPDFPYVNPARCINIGLRRALGEIVVLQNAECLHASEEVIEALAAPHREHPNLAVFASVSSRKPDGAHDHWYVHPREGSGPRPFFFCGSVRREHFHRLRGMDEKFQHYGWEDDEWAIRMQIAGLRFAFREDVTVHHQWHPNTNCFGMRSNIEYFNAKVPQMMARRIPLEANDENWGSLDS